MAFRLMAVLPATGSLFTGWLLWQLNRQWDSLDITDRVLAVLLVAASLGFSVLAYITLHAAFIVRHAPQPGTAPDRDSRPSGGGHAVTPPAPP